MPNETYQYDPQGRRISKTVGAVTTHYRYNGDDIDAEYSQTWNEIARYVHGAGVDDPLMRLTGATASPDAQTRYYAQNGINSIVAYFGDIAQGAAVTATSVTATNSYNASAYPPAKLIDGDTSGTSVWGGNLASGPASVTLELGAVRPVSHLTLYKANFGSSYNVKDVQVQIRNGGIWTNVGSLTNNLADNPEIVLTNASGDAIKVIIQSAQSGTAAFMAEVSMVYDGGAQTVATQRFDAWGNKTQSAGAAIPQYGYTGREPDATGLVYYRARYYDPTTGRFISRDPAGMPDGVNQYAYVGNNPTNATDPTGEVLNFIGGAILNIGVGGAIRMATGGNFWDAKGIAIDAGVGLATSGAGALASLRHLRNLENAVASGTRFTGSVQGVAQVTGKGTNIDHGVRSVFEAQKLVKSQGGTAYLDASISKVGVTGTAKNFRPDVTHVAKNGGINTLEVASVSQQSGGARA